jgi:hypothetical protein
MEKSFFVNSINLLICAGPLLLRRADDLDHGESRAANDGARSIFRREAEAVLREGEFRQKDRISRFLEF